MAYSFTPPRQSPGDVQALLGLNRLEGRPRSPEFNRALRAEVRDPAWLLARQWQLREFRAEDRGAPAYTEVSWRELPLSTLALPGQAGRPYSPATQPLEAAVEAQPRPVGMGLRLQMGQYWGRLLRAQPGVAALAADDQAASVSLFAQAFALTIPTATLDPVAYAQAGTTPEATELLAIVGAAAIDGYALYEAILQSFTAQIAGQLADSEQLKTALAQLPLAQQLKNNSRVVAQDPVTALDAAMGIDWGGLDEAARQYVLAFHRLYLLGYDSPSWSNEKLAYEFTLGTAGATGLGSRHYPGGAALPWYAVDQQPAPADTPAASTSTSTTQRRLATGVQFPGAPATRWWEFEDRRVDFGQVTGDASDWGRMLLQEFVFLYQNDWFSTPYTIAAGTVCALDAVRVVDVFNRTYVLQAAGAGQRPEPDDLVQLIDNDENRWRLFAQTDPTASGPAAAPQLYIPAAVRSPLVSQPLEQVTFRREEATNLVWAVESVISDGFAGGLDGARAASQTTEALRRLALANPATGSQRATTYTYQLASTVPENWVPFVAATDTQGRPALAQGALPRQIAGLSLSAVQPRTTLLQGDLNQPYYLHAHEVPPGGVRVDGLSYRARWHDGRTLHWFGRQRGPALVGGSSGLTFDQLLPTESA